MALPPFNMLGALAGLGVQDPNKLAMLLAQGGIAPEQFLQATQAASGAGGVGPAGGLGALIAPNAGPPSVPGAPPPAQQIAQAATQQPIRPQAPVAPNSVPIGAQTPVQTAAAQQAAGPGLGDRLGQLEKALGTLKPPADAAANAPQPQLLGGPAVNTTSGFRPQGLNQLLQLILSGAGGGAPAGSVPSLGQLIAGR